VGQVFCEVGDDLEQLAQLGRIAAAQVVGREQIEGRDRDADVVAPLKELSVLRGASSMTVSGGFELPQSRPATIPVDDHRDVTRQRVTGERSAKSVLVEAIQKATTEGNLPLLHSATLVHRPRPASRER
jgi:hypothetical protein